MRSIDVHPCFSNAISGRIHLPIANQCNLSCNFCKTRMNEFDGKSFSKSLKSIMTKEQSLQYLEDQLKMIPLKVVGICGPGDPLCNKEVFDVLEIIKDKYPKLITCMCTNGILLQENVQKLTDLFLDSLTITLCSFKNLTIEKIYSSVTIDGCTYKGKEAAFIIKKRQEQALHLLQEFSGLKKVNIIYIQGINSDEIESMCDSIKNFGDFNINIIKLIPNGLFKNIRTNEREYRELCKSLRQKHIILGWCNQCTEDACGYLDRGAVC